MKTKPFQPPAELRERMPMLNAAGYKLFKRLLEHPHAPRWNHEGGDRLQRGDLQAVKEFAAQLATQRKPWKPGEVPEKIIRWVKTQRASVPSFRHRISAALDYEKRWAAIPTMSREDIAVHPELLVPDDADLERMIVYRTAGTTGHALLVPNDPRSVACYQPMVELALKRHGVQTAFKAGMVAGFLVGAQARTVTCPAALSYWRNAGFAKLNLNASEWPSPESVHRYFEEFAPCFLSGDPIAFAEMMRLGISTAPAAMISTAVAMSAALKKKLRAHYRCPVIEWYSLTETGPIGYACPRGHGYHVLPHDLFVEAIGRDGKPVRPGQRGEITLTGGRNPFLPLLRYRTGDWGRLDFKKCPCGDSMPRILDLEGRAPVVFRASDGGIVNTVDISRVLREFPILQHEFIQHANRSCELTLRTISPNQKLDPKPIEAALRKLFGDKVKIKICFDAQLGNRAGSDKVVPYKSELLLED
jgi:phenylacetate-CoA ligase